MVTFSSGPRRETPKTGLTTTVKNRSNSIPSLGGEMITVYLLDDTKRAIMTQPYTTGAMLKRQLVEKLEIMDAEFFEIAELCDGKERWLRPDLYLRSQGITSSSRLVFKARILYYDVSELSSSTSIFLYFLQVKQMVLSGDCPLTEGDAVDLASLQLQATFGDYDQESQKGSLLK